MFSIQKCCANDSGSVLAMEAMDWLTIPDHSATCMVRRNFPDLTVTLLAFVVMLSDANLTKTSPPLCIGQYSTEIRLILGQSSVELRAKRRPVASSISPAWSKA